MTYSPSTGTRWIAWNAFGRLRPGDVVRRRERLRVATAAAVRSQARQRRRAASADRRAPRASTFSAAEKYFSISAGESDSTSRDVVEAVAGIVLREIVGRMHVDAEQIPDRVVVFGAVQPSRRDAARIGRREPVDARELAREPAGDRLPLMLGRLRLVVGRHLACAQLQHDLVPAVAIVDQRLRPT